MNEKLSVLDEKIAGLNKSAEQFKNGITGENDFAAHFKKHGNIKALTRPILTELSVCHFGTRFTLCSKRIYLTYVIKYDNILIEKLRILF